VSIFAQTDLTRFGAAKHTRAHHQEKQSPYKSDDHFDIRQVEEISDAIEHGYHQGNLNDPVAYRDQRSSMGRFASLSYGEGSHRSGCHDAGQGNQYCFKKKEQERHKLSLLLFWSKPDLLTLPQVGTLFRQRIYFD